MFAGHPKFRGLKLLGKKDWIDRLERLTELGKQKMLSHVIVDGKIENKVPVEKVVAHAKERGLIAAVVGEQLHITRPLKEG